MAIIMQYFLPVVPDSAPIVINVNQYDYDDPSYAGRLVFNLIYEGTAYDMTGATAMIQGTKPDGKEFAYVASVSGSVVRAKLTQQMTAVYGRTVGNIIVNDTDGNRVGTFAFWMEVQKSALSGEPDPSETEIPALIALATEQAMAAQQSATSAAASADEAEAYTGHPAYIGLNGDWYVFNTTTGLFEDSGVDARGRSGNRWYVGTAVSGKSTTPTAYATGIDLAYVGDMYLNKSEGAIYECTLGGDAATALWKYDMTLTGGGASVTVVDNLTSTSSTDALSANQGRILKGMVDGKAADSPTFTQADTRANLASGETLSTLFGKLMKWYADLKAVAFSGSYSDLSNKPTIPTVNDGTFNVQQNGTTKGSSTANQSGTTSANIITDEFYGTTATVSSGSFSFTGLDDTKGWAYEPYVVINGSSTNKNPYAELSTVSGAETASMSLTYTTDADNGATVKLRIIK